MNFGRFLAIVFIVAVVIIALLDYLLPGTVCRIDKIQQMYSEHLCMCMCIVLVVVLVVMV